jgi:hypothetical protein
MEIKLQSCNKMKRNFGKQKLTEATVRIHDITTKTILNMVMSGYCKKGILKEAAQMRFLKLLLNVMRLDHQQNKKRNVHF